jgi:hypothetical protein
VNQQQQISMPNLCGFYHIVNHISMLNMFQHTGAIFRVKDIHPKNGDHSVDQNGTVSTYSAEKTMKAKLTSQRLHISNDNNAVL